jgi:predicted nucleic acid-binding protein
MGADAAYLAVAFDVGGTLVTADAKLLRSLLAEDPALALDPAI